MEDMTRRDALGAIFRGAGSVVFVGAGGLVIPELEKNEIRIEGDAGEEGFGIEYIYIATSDAKIAPEIPGVGWEDNPNRTNMTKEKPFIWVAGRRLVGRKCGKWSDPVLYAHHESVRLA